jgi:myxalamid-type polyketide synthase MxaC
MSVDRSEMSPLKRALVAIEKLQRKVESLERTKNEPIAVVGAGCRFPGGASDLDSYWSLLASGRDAISDTPRAILERAPFDSNPSRPGTVVTRWGGFIDGHELFDAAFFGIAPREAASLDPQHRLLLEVSWEALGEAGIAPDRLEGTSTGVFVGSMATDQAQHLFGGSDLSHLDAYGLSGCALSTAAGRISYLLGLRGPSVGLDTACASSMTAVHFACQSLRAKESDLALAGGVNIAQLPGQTVSLSKAQMLSPRGRCRTFDASADGYVRSEGCGMIVLERLSDALANNRSILGLILGSAINHVGSSSGLTVPSGPAQEKLLLRALETAGVAPEEVSYVEAHGTGTPLGDPIELHAIGNVLARPDRRGRALVVSSVKTNLGHLEGASGIAGFIKVLLMFEHAQIPRHLHLETPSPHIDWTAYAIEVPTEPRPWPKGQGRRIAGVSSFGFGGSNSHVVVAEPPERPWPSDEGAIDRPRHLLTISSKHEGGLGELARRYADALRRPNAPTFSDACFTANTGRLSLEHRLAIVAGDNESAASKLEAFANGRRVPGIASGKVASGREPSIAFLFSGQGSQYAGMCRELFERQPVFKEALTLCDEILRSELDRSLLSIIHPSPGEASPIDETTYAQPALFAIEHALFELWRSWGVRPKAVMGHSLGEIVAASVAGVLSLEDGLRLACLRGRMMGALPRIGAMAAVTAGHERILRAIAPHASLLSLAAINAPDQTVISGDASALDRVLSDLALEGIEARRLSVSHAFHSPLMEPMLREFEAAAAKLSYRAPEVPLVGNLEGRMLAQAPGASYWRRHVREPVRFMDGVRVLEKSGIDVFIEIGPQPVVLASAQSASEAPEDFGWLASVRRGKSDVEQMLTALGELFVRGARIDFEAFDRPFARRRVRVPSYVFQRERHWKDVSRRAPEPLASNDRSLLGRRIESAASPHVVFESEISAGDPPHADHKIAGATVVAGATHLASAFLACREARGLESCTLSGISFVAPLVLAEEEQTRWQIVLTSNEGDRGTFALYSHQPGGWVMHASGSYARPSAPASTDVLRAPSSGRWLAKDEIHRAISCRGIELGGRFRFIDRVRAGAGEAEAELTIPSDLEARAELRAEPGLLDAAFHLLGFAIGQGDETYVPMAIDRVGFGAEPEALPLTARARVVKDDRANGAFTGDVVISDAGGRIVLSVEGGLCRAVDPTALSIGAGRSRKPGRYEMGWQPTGRAAPSNGDATLEGRAFAIVGGDGGLVARLAESLGALGARCAFISGSSEDELRSLLSDLGPGVDVLHAGALDVCALVRGELPGAIDPVTDAAVALESARMTARVLASSLKDPRPSSRLLPLDSAAGGRVSAVSSGPALTFLTSGALPVLGSKVEPAEASIWGFARALAAEEPDLAVRAIDLDPSGWPLPLAELAHALGAPRTENQLAIRSGELFLARLRRSEPETNARPLVIRADRTYLITGGLGAIGLRLAAWLCRKGARSIALLQRREATVAARSAIAGLEAEGCRVSILRADVADRSALESAIDSVRAHQAPIGGVFHAAGILDDRLASDSSAETLARVVRPKAAGAFNLHLLTRDLELEMFVLFSSIVATLGNAGQTAYAAANAFLDALAHQRRSLGLPALSVAFGPWAGDGMAAGAARHLARSGLDLLDPDEALDELGSLLVSGATSAGVAVVRWPVFAARIEGPALPGWMADLVPKQDKAPSRARSLLQLDQGSERDRRRVVFEHVRSTVARVLGIDEDRFDASLPFRESGLDSLMAATLAKSLGAEAGLDLSPTAIYNHPTVETLARFLSEALAPPEAHAAAGDGIERESPKTQDEAEIAGLSEAELEALIHKESSRLLERNREEP